jgi:hypothetical protein
MCGAGRAIDRCPYCAFGCPIRSTQNAINPLAFVVVVETVRREKALDFSGCNSRPGTGSLHPVAIEAAAEATKLSELSV